MTTKFQCTHNECNGDDCCPDGNKCNPPIRSTYGIKCHREERAKFKPIKPECKKDKLTWEKCNLHFGCDEGEECWFSSEDYYNDCGKGSVNHD